MGSPGSSCSFLMNSCSSHQFYPSSTCFIFSFPRSLQLSTGICLSCPGLTKIWASQALCQEKLRPLGQELRAPSHSLLPPGHPLHQLFWCFFIIFCEDGAIKKKPSWTRVVKPLENLICGSCDTSQAKARASDPPPFRRCERHLHSFSVHPATEHKSALTLSEK